MTRAHFFAAVWIVLSPVSARAADARPIPLSLEDYTLKAIDQGIRGRENALTLEEAGYVRQIAFRQTDSPSLSAAYLKAHSEQDVSGSNTLTDTYQSALTLSEPLPTGTVLTGQARYDADDRSGWTATVSQPIYLFVKNSVLRGRKKAALSFESAKSSYLSDIRVLQNQARSLYYAVMISEESIQVESRKVQASQALHEVTLALVEAGKLAPVESMRSKIRLQSDQRQLYNAQVSLEKSALAAKNFIYLPLDQPVTFLTQLQFKPLKVDLNRLLDYALLHRPELAILRRSRETAHLDAQSARETTRPQLSLISAYDNSKNRSLVTRTWSITGNANWLFFDSFVTRDQASVARIGEIVADLNLADTERSTRVDVTSAFLDIKNAERQIVDFQATLDQAHHNVEVIRIRFQSGLDRLIDVFDAENDARSLDLEYLNLLAGYNRSLDTLAQLVGGNLEDIP